MLTLLICITSAFAQTPEPLRDPQVLRFQKDLEQIRDLRIETKLLYDRIAPLVNAPKPEPLSGDDLTELDVLAKRHSFFSSELTSFVHMGAKEPIVYPMTVSRAIPLTLELSASLTFADSVDQVISLFEANPKLRVILNRPNPTYERPSDALYEAMQNYYSIKHYDRRAILIQAFEEFRKSPELKTSPELRYLAEVIQQSPTYRKYVSQTAKEHSKERFMISKLRGELQAAKASDRLEDFFTHQIAGSASKAFGNLVGSIQFRKGKIFQNAEIAEKMKSLLKPGDLLLEATPFRATSYFIPGFYGHVALWIGTEAELKSLDLWNTKPVHPYQSKIKNGSSILEALRSGVELNPVEHFLDIDDLLILRPNSKISEEQIKSAILSGMTHVGQPYDFNFDVSSNDKLVCSELAFTTYTSVRFRLEQTMGRWTISPDAVAEQGLPGGAFTPVMMVRDGKIIETNLVNELRSELKKSKKSGSLWPKSR